ncbi:MAG: hypothetical protein HRT74_13320 [Flavobacteriales bacterium]|nr:hypothetical protein [Flavobacteriales bacterium]
MKNSIILFALIMISSYSFSQGTTHIYDFQSGKAGDVTHANYEQMTHFEVQNINRFIYDVTINGEVINYNTTSPQVFQILSSNISTNVSDIQDAEENTLAAEADDAPALESLAKNISQIETLQQIGDGNFTTMWEISSLDGLYALSEPTKMNLTLEEFKLAFESQQSEFISRKTSLSKFDQLLLDLTSNALTINKLFQQLEEWKAYQNEIGQIYQRSTLDENIAGIEISRIKDEYVILLKVSDLERQFTAAASAFKDAHSNYIADEDVQGRYDSKNEVIASVKDLKEEVERVEALVAKTNYKKIANDTNTLIDELLDPKSYVVHANPLQADADEVNFDIKIAPKSGINSGILTSPTDFTYSVPVRGGIKIDFSAGLVTEMPLFNASYSAQMSEDSTSFTLSKDTRSEWFDFNLGAFVHVYRRNTGNTRWAGTFGIGLNNTSLDDLDFYLGGSYIWGRQDRFIATGGISLTKTQVLNSDLDTGTAIDISKLSESYTTEQIRPGFFLGFSYNLSN